MSIVRYILSILHNTYCMSIYCYQLRKFSPFSKVNRFVIAWRKTARRTLRINFRKLNVLMNKINRCALIDIVNQT